MLAKTKQNIDPKLLIVFMSSCPNNSTLSLNENYLFPENENIYSVTSYGTMSKVDNGIKTPYMSIIFPGKLTSHIGRYRTIYRELIKLQIYEIPIRMNILNAITMIQLVSTVCLITSAASFIFFPIEMLYIYLGNFVYTIYFLEILSI